MHVKTTVKMQSDYFKTKDEVQLHYVHAGQGRPVLFLAGGGFSVNIFQYQYPEFSQHFEVLALDHRGHGLSDKVDFGYRIARFAKDLHEFLQDRQLTEVALVCHSLGASVGLEYIDLFGSHRLSKLVLIDEPPVLLINAGFTMDQRADYGSIYDPETMHELLAQFTSDKADEFKDSLIDMMTTKNINPKDKEFIRKCMDLPNSAASVLYLNNLCQDYRDVLKKIDVPTLFITGRASIHPWQSFEWMQKQVKGFSLSIFEEDQGGSHFMFVENPEQFNKTVIQFLSK